MQFLNGSMQTQSVYRKLLKDLNTIESELQNKDILINIIPFYLLFTEKSSETLNFSDFVDFFDRMFTTPPEKEIPEFFYLKQDNIEATITALKNQDIRQKIVSLFSRYKLDISEFKEESNRAPTITPEWLGYLHEERIHDKKKKGVFYTPKLIAKAMCRRALYYYISSNMPTLNHEQLNYLFNHNFNEKPIKNFFQIKQKELEQIKNLLTEIRILDNACGTGIFLISMLHELFRMKLIIEDLSSEKEEPMKSDNIICILKNIINNSLFGIDIDEEAVRITKIRLFFASYSLYREVIGSNQTKQEILGMLKVFKNLSFNIKAGNSLLDKIFEGKFNIIIGNPPYVKEYEDRSIFAPLKTNPYYQGKMDIWYLFTCIAIDMLQNNGILTYIAQSNWTTSYGAKKLREKIRTSATILEFIDFTECKIFGKAEIQTMIMHLRKTSISNLNPSYTLLYKKILSEKISEITLTEFLEQFDRKQTDHYTIEHLVVETGLSKNRDDSFRFHNNLFQEISSEIYKNPNIIYLTSEEIGNGCDVHQYKVKKEHLLKLKRERISEEHGQDTIRLNDGIFVLTEEEYNKIRWSDLEVKEILKPFYTPEDIDKYFISKANRFWIIYTKSDINSKIDAYPNVKAHLDKFKLIITSDNRPYGLHRARKQSLFEDKKILSLRKTSKPIFTYSEKPVYVGQSYFIIQPKNIDYFYLLGILNSKLSAFWLKHKGKMQGKNYQIDLEPLLGIPIIQSSDQRDSLSLMTEMIVKYKPKSDYLARIAKIIDYLVYELYFHHHFFKLGIYESKERVLSNTIHTIMSSFPKTSEEIESENNKVLFKILDSISKKFNDDNLKPIIEKIKQHDWIRQIEQQIPNN